MSYDTKCFILAAEFLDDHPDIKNINTVELLAQEIQTAIEEFIEEQESKLK